MFGFKVGARALIAPFYGHEGLREGGQWGWRRAQGQSRFRVCGVDFCAFSRVGGWDARGCEERALAFDGAVEVLGEGVVDDADEGL